MSAFGIPLLGLCGIVYGLWHTNTAMPASADAAQELTFLQDPSPRLDKSLTVCLRQQAKDVLRSRAGIHPERTAQAIADYNMIARECTPAVFTATHLPSSL